MKQIGWRWAVVAAVTLSMAIGSAFAGNSGAIQFKLGGFFPDGDDEFWRDAEETFTQDISDFDDVVLGVTYVHPWGNHLEIGFNADFYDRTITSAVDGFVDGLGLPILHDTTLSMLPVSMDFRVLPTGRHRVGKSRKSYRPAFYVGAGVGFVLWEYEEIGEFVDFSTDEIFFDRFIDDGGAFEAHALAGIEVPFSNDWGAMIEVKQIWADDKPRGDFAGLGTLDLSGTMVSVGAILRF